MADTVTSAHIRTTHTLSSENLQYLAPFRKFRQYSLTRFASALPSDGPYYTTATTEMRSHHTEEISNQIRAVEKIFKHNEERE